MTPANLALRDGRLVHVTMMNASIPWGGYTDPCEQAADVALSRRLLLGKLVTVTAPPRVNDTPSIVPSGHTEVDVVVAGRDYAQEFEQQVYDGRAKCRPTYKPAPATDTAPVTSGGDVDVDLDHHDDTNHRDGSATFGFCRHRRWC